MTNNNEEYYNGDELYSIDCSGDCCIGDSVKFRKAVFSGSFKSPKFEGYVMITGEIVRESYGPKKQQHTFTLKLEDGSHLRIKGRNLYANRVFRKKWYNELDRIAIIEEKHERGKLARELRTRLELKYEE